MHFIERKQVGWVHQNSAIYPFHVLSLPFPWFSFAQLVDCGWSDLKIMYRFLQKLCMIDCTSSLGWPTKLFKIMELSSFLERTFAVFLWLINLFDFVLQGHGMLHTSWAKIISKCYFLIKLLVLNQLGVYFKWIVTLISNHILLLIRLGQLCIWFPSLIKLHASPN